VIEFLGVLWALAQTPAGIGALTALGFAVIGRAGERAIAKSKDKNDKGRLDLDEKKQDNDEGARMREELRTELETARTAAAEAERREDEWRDRYYKQLEELVNTKAKLTEALSQIEQQAATAKDSLS